DGVADSKEGSGEVDLAAHEALVAGQTEEDVTAVPEERVPHRALPVRGVPPRVLGAGAEAGGHQLGQIHIEAAFRTNGAAERKVGGGGTDSQTGAGAECPPAQRDRPERGGKNPERLHHGAAARPRARPDGQPRATFPGSTTRRQRACRPPRSPRSSSRR